MFQNIGNFVFGQENTRFSGGRQAGLAGISSCLTDLWSAANNPAGSAMFGKRALGFYYRNNFGLKELSFQSLVFNQPLGRGALSLRLSYFGSKDYNESLFSLGYAKKIFKNYALAVRLDYFLTHIEGIYGNAGAAFADIGFIGEPIEDLTLGIHLVNPGNRQIFGNDLLVAESLMRFGLAYQVSEHFMLATEIEKDIEFPLVYKAGFEMELVNNLFIMAGIATNPGNISFGIAYRLGNMRADFSFLSHQQLGISPHASVDATF